MSRVIKIEAVIHGDIPESSSKCVYYVNQPVTLNDIINYFPFEGKFHYRLNIPGELIHDNTKSLWLDLFDGSDKLIQRYVNDFHVESIQIQAVFLDDIDKYPSNNNINKQYKEIIDKISENLNNNRPDRQEISSTSSNVELKKSKNLNNITLKTVKESATSVWKTFKATAAHIQQSLINNPNTSTLSDLTENNLSQLSEDIAVIYSEDIPEHASLIPDLWRSLFLNEPYSRYSDKWREAGFQKDNPVEDLKTSGLLAIKCMVYLGKHYPMKTQDMIKNNKQNIKTKYPFAIVAVNITILLIEVLKLRDQIYLSIQAGYWEMFESPNAFYEIFCALFFHVDSTWSVRGAVRSDFSKIMNDVKSLVVLVLSKSPKSLLQFRHIALEVGMLFPEV